MTVDIGNGVLMYTRAEWGARPPEGVTPVDAEDGVALHWEGPHMGSFPHSSCAPKVRGIQAFHMDGQGWVDIAYSRVGCPHGYVFEGRGPNVRTAANGTDACNDGLLAVCYLGGEGDPFTDAGKRAMRAAADHLDRAGAGSGRVCHRDCKSTQCPGDVICQWVRAGLPVTGTTPPTTGDWLDMATKAEVQQAIEDGTRKVLNEGTGKGLTNWRDTNKEILDVARAVYNQTGRSDLAAGVDEAFTTSGSGTRQQIAGDADGDIQSLVDLALQRSPTFVALAAQVQAIAEAVGAAPTRQVPTA